MDVGPTLDHDGKSGIGQTAEISTVDDYDSELDEFSVTLELERTGETGSGYRTRNDPCSPFQRKIVIERRGILEVRCKSREVIHGILSPDEDLYATMLVYEIQLDTTKRSRRIISATVNFEFDSLQTGTAKPMVHSIAPEGPGWLTLSESWQHEITVQAGELTARAPDMVGCIGGSFKKEKVVCRTTTDSARVRGDILCDEYGKEYGARWLLQENPSTKSGVPSLLRCAILLVRRDESLFQCKVSIKVEADWKTEMGKLTSSTPRTDPILFDPGLPPANKHQKCGYNLGDLGSVNLSELVGIRFATVIEECQK